MAGDVPLPKRVFAHGWLLFENDKMSKSRGNIVRAEPIRQVMGLEALRYFLFREVVFGQDGSFSFDALVGRYNSELANGLGNLASRTLTMIKQYRDGVIPHPSGALHLARGFGAQRRLTLRRALSTRSNFRAASKRSGRCFPTWIRFIVEQAPWKLAKSTEPDAAQQLDDALYASAETLRIAVALLHPVLPESTANIWAQLGMTQPIEAARDRETGMGPAAGGAEDRHDCSGLPAHRSEERDRPHARARRRGNRAPGETAGQASCRLNPPAEGHSAAFAEDRYRRFRARSICESARCSRPRRVKGADKLLHLKVDIGEPEPRTIVAGIAAVYEPEKIVGRKVVIVANLHPRKLRGIESNGMIVAASLEGGKPMLAGFLEDVPVGVAIEVTMFVDSHCHLDDERFADRSRCRARSRRRGRRDAHV